MFYCTITAYLQVKDTIQQLADDSDEPQRSSTSSSVRATVNGNGKQQQQAVAAAVAPPAPPVDRAAEMTVLLLVESLTAHTATSDKVCIATAYSCLTCSTCIAS
jgi:hypothetical protein